MITKFLEMSDHKNIVIYAMKEIESLEAKNVRLETENRHLKSALEKQTDFGNKMTELIAKMDLLLNKKKSEIESLTSQLRIPPIDSKNEVSSDFRIKLEVNNQNNGLLEIQKQSKIDEKTQLEKNKDGKFKCQYEDICDFASTYPENVREHMRLHTEEKPYGPYICDFCGKEFKFQSTCKNHMMTHPEMNGVKCKYCTKRFLQQDIEGHMIKCSIRSSRKNERKRK